MTAYGEAVAVGWWLLAGLVVLKCYDNVEAYMDEIFHIPQAQHYCNGEFHVWNKGITTFPGVYIVAFAAARAISIVQSVSCSTQFLRAVTVFISSTIPVLLYRCRNAISPGSQDSTAVALILYLYPLNAFYYFLYYTDTLSTTTLILTYWLCLRGNPTTPNAAVPANSRSEQQRAIPRRSLSSQLLLLLAASASVLARQTNAVWLMFLVGTDMLRYLSAVGEFQDDSLNLGQLVRFLLALWRRRRELLLRTWPLLLPVVAFAAFVLKTGSIVLGDKENHQPVLHFAMPAHALVLIAVVSAPITISQWASKSPTLMASKNLEPSGATVAARASWWRPALGYAVLGAAAGYALLYKSYSHPFLLSDNRHYMFYIWKRILSKEHIRLLLSPFYGAAACVAIWRLRQRHGPLWVLIFLVALVITLVPTPLLEPRYFTPAVVVAVLNSPTIDLRSTGGIAAVGTVVAAMLLVNVVTIVVFITRPFQWGDGSIARFMY